jgi:hypothetical protein
MNTMSDPYRETQGYGAKIIYERDMVPYCEKHPLEDDPGMLNDVILLMEGATDRGVNFRVLFDFKNIVL